MELTDNDRKIQRERIETAVRETLIRLRARLWDEIGFLTGDARVIALTRVQARFNALIDAEIRHEKQE